MSTPAVPTTEDIVETTETETPEGQPGAGEEGTPTGETGTEGTDDPPADDDTDEPIEARLERRERELRSVREEAAKRRTQVRDLETKLSEAKTQEDVDAAVAEYREQVAKLERQIAVTQLVTEHGLDARLQKLLEKVPTEELEEQAKLLAEFAPKKQQSGGSSIDDLSGGLRPGKPGVDSDITPAEAAKRSRRRRY